MLQTLRVQIKLTMRTFLCPSLLETLADFYRYLSDVDSKQHEAMIIILFRLMGSVDQDFKWGPAEATCLSFTIEPSQLPGPQVGRTHRLGRSWTHQKARLPTQLVVDVGCQPVLLRVVSLWPSHVAQAKQGLSPRASILGEIPEESVS